MLRMTAGPLAVMCCMQISSMVRQAGNDTIDHLRCWQKMMATPPPRPDLSAVSTTAYPAGVLRCRQTLSWSLCHVSISAKTSNNCSVIVCCTVSVLVQSDHPISMEQSANRRAGCPTFAHHGNSLRQLL